MLIRSALLVSQVRLGSAAVLAVEWCFAEQLSQASESHWSKKVELRPGVRSRHANAAQVSAEWCLRVGLLTFPFFALHLVQVLLHLLLATMLEQSAAIPPEVLLFCQLGHLGEVEAAALATAREAL